VYALSTAGASVNPPHTFYLVPRPGHANDSSKFYVRPAACWRIRLGSKNRRAAASFWRPIGALLLRSHLFARLLWPPNPLTTGIRVMHKTIFAGCPQSPSYSQTTLKFVQSGPAPIRTTSPSVPPSSPPIECWPSVWAQAEPHFDACRSPQLRVDAVEILIQVADVAARYFRIAGWPGNLTVPILPMRARALFPRRSSIWSSGYLSGGPYIPFYLITRNFLKSSPPHRSRRASPDGRLLYQPRSRALLAYAAHSARLSFRPL